MITLGGVSLPDGDGNGWGTVQWVDRRTGAASMVAHDGRRTRGGAYRYSQTALTGGRPVTLSTSTEGGLPAAWLTTEMMDAIEPLAMAGQPVELNYRWTVMQVVFRHAQQPVLAITELHPGAGRFVGEIRLETV